jgi:hypothetical protein
MIGEKAREEAKKLLGQAVDEHWPEIKEAYIKAKTRMRVGMGVIFEPDKSGEKIEVRISLVTGRLKDSYDSVVNELQDPLIVDTAPRPRAKGKKADT